MTRTLQARRECTDARERQLVLKARHRSGHAVPPRCVPKQREVLQQDRWELHQGARYHAQCTARPRALLFTTIAWCQFLIDHTGIPRGRFAPAVSPLDIEDEVLTLLDANDVIRVSARGGGSVKGPSMYVERLAEHVAMPHACLCT